MTTKISKKADLVPGILYCLFAQQYNFETGERYDEAGQLVYWSGSEFLFEDGETCNDFYDYAVPQSDKPDPDYIDATCDGQCLFGAAGEHRVACPVWSN